MPDALQDLEAAYAAGRGVSRITPSAASLEAAYAAERSDIDQTTRIARLEAAYAAWLGET